MGVKNGRICVGRWLKTADWVGPENITGNFVLSPEERVGECHNKAITSSPEGRQGQTRRKAGTQSYRVYGESLLLAMIAKPPHRLRYRQLVSKGN